MTVFLVICLLLIFPLLGGASYFGYHVFSILLLALIVMIIVSFVEYLYLRKRLITGKIKVSSEMPRGDLVRFSLPVQLKTRWLPVRVKLSAWYGLADKSVLPQKEIYFRDLRAGDDLEIFFTVAARHTGKLVLDEARMEVRTFFGLFKFKRKFREHVHQLATIILPLPEKTDNSIVRAIEQVEESELAKRRIEERSDEIDTMRAYNHGDDVRRIHWPVSSRLNELVVKQYEAPIAIETHILFDDFTGYSLQDDIDFCDRALTRRDRILDSVSGSIAWLLRHDMAVVLHTGLTDSARERLGVAKELSKYKRLLAMMKPDSLPPLGEMIESLRVQGEKDRYLLFSSRISKASAAAIISLKRTAFQVIYFYFNKDNETIEEKNALRMIRRADIEVVEIYEANATGSPRYKGREVDDA